MKKARKKTTGKNAAPPACAVLLAGGRGTRFWPRSRMRTPKQLLDIVGQKTMLHATASRLAPLIPRQNIWAVTNIEQAAPVRRELRGVPASQILAEPVGRNTAAAIGLAAIHLAHAHGDALMAVLPSDAYVAHAAQYRKLVRAALELARAPGNLVVLGIPPTRPETGYGYIECAGVAARPRGVAAFAVRRFTEKPELPVAQKYVSSGKYFWNAGMFFWRASTFLGCLRQFLPQTHAALAELSATIGTKRYASALRRFYPRLENISVDYAVMEPATRARLEGRGFDPTVTRAQSVLLEPLHFRGSELQLRHKASKGEGASAPEAPSVFVIPAKIGWSDIGSWAAVYELLAERSGANSNVCAGPSFTLDASGNYLWSPKKFIAAIGVKDLVLVETDDAILLCHRSSSQDVAKIVKHLESQKLPKLL